MSIRAKQTQFGVFSSDEGCHCEQTKPIPAGGTRPAELPADPSLGHGAPNKPNSHQRGWQDVVQTNPIPALVPIRRSAFPGRGPRRGHGSVLALKGQRRAV